MDAPAVLRRTKVLGPEIRPLHVERGWIRDGGWYRGNYRTKYGVWPGAIFNANGESRVFIGNIREQDFKRHSHWRCFHRDRNGWYSIHMSKLPADGGVDGLILCVERLINEALSLARK